MGTLRLAVVVATVAVVVVQGQEALLPDIWKVVENSYDSRVTVNFLNEDVLTTMLVDELYDISEEKGALEAIARGTTTTINYYSKSDQAFVAKETTCTVRPVKELEEFGLWGWIYNNEPSEGGATNFLFGPSALLRLVRDYSRVAEYIPGEHYVRGIRADIWLILAGEYIIYYSFASEVWLMPYGHVLEGVELRAPLRVEVIGVQKNPWNIGANAFNQTVVYEYTEFKPYVELKRRKHFLVHEGLHCEGRKSLDPDITTPPRALNDFQVFIETVMREPDSGAEILPKVYRSWLYYSNWASLLRIDVNPDQDILEPERSYRSIHDYNTGIQYKIDMETGECDMKALDENQLGIQLGSGIIADVIMGNKDIPFSLDDKYIFNGYSETRGIKTTRWTATRDDIIDLDSGKNYKKVVVDYQFKVKGKNFEGQDDTVIPVRVDATVYSNDTDIILTTHTANFLHMQSSFQVYDFNPFHVGECMDTPVMRKWIKFIFLGDWNKGASQGPDAFKKHLVDNIVKSTAASFIRFPEVQLQHANNEVVHATALILEPAPYTLQFKQVNDRSPTDCDRKSSVNIFGAEGCAYHCLTYDDFACNSFYECKKGTGKGCYVSNYKNNVPDSCEDIGVSPCNHYNKAIIKGTKFQMPIFEIETVLALEILFENFNITLPYNDPAGEPQKGVYFPIAFEEAIVSDDPFFVDLIGAGYRTAFPHAKLKSKFTELQKKQVSYSYCLALCMEQVAFECQSFSYCYDTSLCMLSSHEVTTPVQLSDVIWDPDCLIISKNHLLNYDKVEGKVYEGDAREVHNGTFLEHCAFLCDNATDFTCRSFDHCSKHNLCQLYDHHTVDQPDGMFNASVGCSHYSRNELIDFTKQENQEISGSRDKFIKDTTPRYCAHVCVDQPDFSCNGFDYCNDGGDITCFLTSEHYSDAGVDIIDSLTCDHYSRDYYEEASRDDIANRPSKYKYGPGDMAALGCSMVIIAIALTFGGVFAYNKMFKK